MRARRMLLAALASAATIAIFACAGKDGAEGPQGPQGPPGDSAEGDGGAGGGSVHRASFASEADLDNGPVPDRTLTFTKASADSVLRVTYYDNLSAQGGLDGGACACRWEVVFNGASCASPGKLFGEVGSVVTQNLRPDTIVGICKGLAAGSMTVGVKVSQSIGTCKCVTGFDKATGFLEVAETE